ncbi:hypothetical protein J5X84_38055 [Streptosporangiaceae bacterium NEAU-GS5]|nr:hypothetical protein [Streptosporangiaceae bacterium NEAU-GS5]
MGDVQGDGSDLGEQWSALAAEAQRRALGVGRCSMPWLAVVVPLEECRALKLTHDWHHSPDRVRTSPEDFLAVSGLTEQEQQVLRERYGLTGPA